MFSCLWHRSDLEAQAAGRLEERSARRVGRHVERCASCRRTVEQYARMRGLVRAGATRPVDPDWSPFWTGVRLRIETEAPRPLRDAWWLPLWKPVWGHPRMATSAAMAGAVALTLTFWPVGQEVGTALADAVTVQDVGTSDPHRSVMVYSNKGDVTVIWVFAADTSFGDQ